MSEVKSEETYYNERVKRAAHMLFFKRGKIPGARNWELRTGLGKGFQSVLSQLDESLKDLDLEVKKVEVDSLTDSGSKGEGEEDYRYFVRLRGTLTPREARMSGWRIDNLAALAACLALAGRWRALTLMDTFLRTGYLEEDEEGLVKLGWRTRAELDLQSLMMLVAESKPEVEAPPEPVEDDQASI